LAYIRFLIACFVPDTSKIGVDINKNCKLKTVVDLFLILILEVILRYRSRSQGMTILNVQAIEQTEDKWKTSCPYNNFSIHNMLHFLCIPIKTICLLTRIFLSQNTKLSDCYSKIIVALIFFSFKLILSRIKY
jgi:hypothetical protein